MLDLICASFFESYGLIIILVVAFGFIMFSYYCKNKKYQETEGNFQANLKAGDKVKTYSGFYGTVDNIRETTDGKVVTLKLGEGAFIEVDIRALMSIDNKTDIVEDENVNANEEQKVETENVETIEPEKVEITEASEEKIENEEK